MKTITFLALVVVLGLLGSCTINPHPMDMSQAIQSAKSRADHEALAKHYEDTAKEMQAKVEEHKKLLAQYESNKMVYRRFWQGFVTHCQGLVRNYEQAVAENMSMAASHRQMASEAK